MIPIYRSNLMKYVLRIRPAGLLICSDEPSHPLETILTYHSGYIVDFFSFSTSKNVYFLMSVVSDEKPGKVFQQWPVEHRIVVVWLSLTKSGFCELKSSALSHRSFLVFNFLSFIWSFTVNCVTYLAANNLKLSLLKKVDVYFLVEELPNILKIFSRSKYACQK